MKKSYLFLIVAAAAVFSGCGGAEHEEAVRFAKILNARQADFSNANRTERQLVEKARAWVANITANGAGKAAALDQNAAVAAELLKAAQDVSAGISQVGVPLNELTLQAQFTKDTRSALSTELTKRQRSLQDLRTALEGLGPAFVALKKLPGYKGDTYPGGITALDTMLQNFRIPEDVVQKALTELKTNYGLKPEEL